MKWGHVASQTCTFDGIEMIIFASFKQQHKTAAFFTSSRWQLLSLLMFLTDPQRHARKKKVDGRIKVSKIKESGGSGGLSSDISCGTVSDIGPRFPRMSKLTFHRSAQYIYSSSAPRSHVIARRSISSCSPAAHLRERACYSVSAVFLTALLWLRGRRSFPFPSFSARPPLSRLSNQGLW